MTTKHTPEPWHAFERDGHWALTAPRCGEVGIVNDADQAARIVACVNACAGINPEAVPELLAARRRQLRGIQVAKEREGRARRLARRGITTAKIARRLGITIAYAEKLVRPGGLWRGGGSKKGYTRFDTEKLRTLLAREELTNREVAVALGCSEATLRRLKAALLPAG